MRFIKETNIDFMKYRKIAFIVSSAIIIIGLISFFLRGIANFGIDFTGGTLVRYEFEKKVEIGHIRHALEKEGIHNSIIQSYSPLEREKGILIRTPGEIHREIKEAIHKNFSFYGPQVVEERVIGPLVGGLLKRQATLAITFAMIGILLYIAWRFKFKYGICAVICLIHDVLFTVGIFSLTGREISLPVIAALLTIIGYSLNDTIVVFDRIRENLKIFRGRELTAIINSSINEVLSRTILTSLTTLLAVLSLLFLGGVVIRDFALALAIGVVIGTYSSIYIAAPLLVVLEQRKLRV